MTSNWTRKTTLEVRDLFIYCDDDCLCCDKRFCKGRLIHDIIVQNFIRRECYDQYTGRRKDGDDASVTRVREHEGREVCDDEGGARGV